MKTEFGPTFEGHLLVSIKYFSPKNNTLIFI